MQTYTGRLCSRCNLGFYPWFGGCEPCPDKKFGLTVNNAFTVIYRYGIIWLLWIIVNRFLCEKLLMADSLLNFAQMYAAWFLRLYVAWFLRLYVAWFLQRGCARRVRSGLARWSFNVPASLRLCQIPGGVGVPVCGTRDLT
jgi:hypothetical protein